MANRYLLPIYKMVYDEDYNHTIKEHVNKMQHMVYLLEEMCVPIGEYGFRLRSGSPFSDPLYFDAEYEWKLSNNILPKDICIHRFRDGERIPVSTEKIFVIFPAPYDSGCFVECKGDRIFHIRESQEELLSIIGDSECPALAQIAIQKDTEIKEEIHDKDKI